MSFANQALSAVYIAQNHGQPDARRVRRARGHRQGGRAPEAREPGRAIDELTEEQRRYLASGTWEPEPMYVRALITGIGGFVGRHLLHHLRG